MNKRGDVVVALYLFVIMMLALFILAFINVLTFENRFKDSFGEQRNVIDSENAIEEYLQKVSEIRFKEALQKGGNIEESFKEEIGKNEIITSSTNYYSWIRNNKFSINRVPNG